MKIYLGVALALVLLVDHAMADIDKAWSACASVGMNVANRVSSAAWKPGYEECSAIHRKWIAENTGKIAAEQQSQQEEAAIRDAKKAADRALIRSLARE